jgi:DNA-binding MarR family transcriptional regulator
MAFVAMLDSLGPMVTVQMVNTFVMICMANDESPGLNMADLGNRLGMGSSTRTRIIQALSVKRGGVDKLPGLDLITTASDPDDSRALLLFPTPKGRRLWAALKEVIGD